MISRVSLHWNFYKKGIIIRISIFYIHLAAFYTGYEYCDCNPVTVEFEWGNTALFKICQKATTLICLRSNYMHDQDILFWNDNAVNKSSKSLNAHLLLFQIFIAPWLIGEKAIVPLLTCNINTLCYKNSNAALNLWAFGMKLVCAIRPWMKLKVLVCVNCLFSIKS